MGRAGRPKAPQRPRVQRSLSEIENEFRAQINFLSRSCGDYDAGDFDEFRRIALAIRILLYDHGQSKSLIGQLGLQSVIFNSYARPISPTNLVSSIPLVMVRQGPDSVSYQPSLDRGPTSPRALNFTDWWAEMVFKSPGGVMMNRSGFVLHTANQAGGAHVDPDLDEEFHKIANENEAGWNAFSGHPSNPTSVKPLENLEKAYVRHIGFEVLEALVPEWDRIKANRTCECGSGRKFRYCHGKVE